MIIIYKRSEISKIPEYLELYKICFKKFNKDEEYLKWLYKKNPLGVFFGFDALHKNKIIAQVGGIPQNYNYKGKKINAVLAVNVCVNPEYRGRNIFSNLAKKFELLSTKKKCSLIVGCSNTIAPLWKRSINMKTLCTLDAFFFLGEPKVNKSISKNIFYRIYDKETINWRTKNPSNNVSLGKVYKKNLLEFFTQTFISFLDISGLAIIKEPNKIRINFMEKKSIFLPKLFVGLTPGYFKKKITFNIPKKLRPSPLYFQYKSLNNENIQLTKKDILFSFLDFDAF